MDFPFSRFIRFFFRQPNGANRENRFSFHSSLAFSISVFSRVQLQSNTKDERQSNEREKNNGGKMKRLHHTTDRLQNQTIDREKYAAKKETGRKR